MGLSVLLSVYVKAKPQHLDACLESLLTQTRPADQIVLVEDGPLTKELKKVIDKYEVLLPLERVRLNKNKGLPQALNEGIKHCTHELLARIDSDDVALPQRFDRQLAYMYCHPECVAVGSRVLFIDSDGLPLCEMLDIFSHEEIDNALLKTLLGIVHPSCTLRINAVKAVGGYRDGLAEDLDLYLRLGEIGNLANLPEVLLEYRQHFESLSYERVKEQALSARQAVMDASIRRGLDWSRLEAAIPDIQEKQRPADIFRKWGWWALSSGNLRSARKHAFKAFWCQPLSIQTWRLCVCAFRGQ